MLIKRRMADLAASFKVPKADHLPGSSEPAWSDPSICRNCGSTMSSPYCGACGQKCATRLSWHDTVRETWDRVRVFEIKTLSTTLRLLLSPGKVAREYVLGRRTVNLHPLKLLVTLVAVLVLILATNRYFGTYGYSGRDAVVDKMAGKVLVYANWSFSIGIFAIYVGSKIGFWRRLGYNTMEHATLAIYCQSVILGVVIVNMLPTLIWRDPVFILQHKAAAQHYLFVIKLLIVGAAYKQFFLLDLRTDWPRWSFALTLYVCTNWLLLRAYAFAIMWLVSPAV